MGGGEHPPLRGQDEDRTRTDQVQAGLGLDSGLGRPSTNRKKGDPGALEKVQGKTWSSSESPSQTATPEARGFGYGVKRPHAGESDRLHGYRVY